MDETIHTGSCHCGAVRFQVQGEIRKVVRCNCAICTKKGALHWRVAPEQFTLLSGEEALSSYRSGSRVAEHLFCRHCGIHPFNHPRSAPDMYSVNVRCLDDIDLEAPSWEEVPFDGRHWEEAVKSFRL